MQILQHGRDVMVESLAEEVLEKGDDLADGGFLFNEFLESQGTRLHFLSLLMSHLEQQADALDEVMATPPSPPPKKPSKRRARSKKLTEQASKEGSAEDR